jgi:hypothetical protein
MPIFSSLKLFSMVKTHCKAPVAKRDFAKNLRNEDFEEDSSQNNIESSVKQDRQEKTFGRPNPPGYRQGLGKSDKSFPSNARGFRREVTSESADSFSSLLMQTLEQSVGCC